MIFLYAIYIYLIFWSEWESKNEISIKRKKRGERRRWIEVQKSMNHGIEWMELALLSRFFF